MTISLQLAAYVAATNFEDLPVSAVDAAKTSMLDTLAVAWAGSEAPGCPEVLGLQQQRGGAQESSTWGRPGVHLPAAAAALVNGLAAAALDYDCMHGGFHADGGTLAAALAVAERQHSSGRSLLRAFILGSDVSCRIAAACHVRRWGWWDTPVITGFGCAAAAGLLLGLDQRRIAHAFGLVYSRTGGTLQLNVDHSLSKRLAMGLAAEAGVNAALMAQAGLTGPLEAFEGEFGFSRVYAPIDPQRLFDGVGRSFSAQAMTFKPYPACGCSHTAIEAALSLMRDHRLAPGDVTAVLVTISPYMNTLVGGEFEPHGSQVAAQFSVRYAIACAIHRGGFTLADLEPAAMRDPAVLQTVRRVAVAVDESSESTRACVLSLEAGGAMHTLRTDTAPGSPACPMEPQRHAAKISDAFARGSHPMTPADIARFTREVQAIEMLPDANRLIKEFSPCQ